MSVIFSMGLGFALVCVIGWVWSRRFGFLGQNSSDYSDEGTPFYIRDRLKGKMLCEGVIYGPTGRVNSRFIADMNAVWDGDTCHMTEEFRYDVGGTLSREWCLHMTGEDRFEATASDVIGTGLGVQSGSSVCLNYRIKLPETAGGFVSDTTDWMYLMENGTIINRSQMRKFGLQVGELVATMRRV